MRNIKITLEEYCADDKCGRIHRAEKCLVYPPNAILDGAGWKFILKQLEKALDTEIKKYHD